MIKIRVGVTGEVKKERERSRVEKTRVSASRATNQCVSEYSKERDRREKKNPVLKLLPKEERNRDPCTAVSQFEKDEPRFD